MLTVAYPKLTQPVCDVWEVIRTSSCSKSGYPGWDGSSRQAGRQPVPDIPSFSGRQRAPRPGQAPAAGPLPWRRLWRRSKRRRAPALPVASAGDSMFLDMSRTYHLFDLPCCICVSCLRILENCWRFCFYVRDPIGGYSTRAQKGTNSAFVGDRENFNIYSAHEMCQRLNGRWSSKTSRRCRVLGATGGNCGAEKGSPLSISGEGSSR